MVKPSNPSNVLPLLAYKIAPRQFDLSYRFSNISLRDQMVRGQSLVRTLVETGLVSKVDKNIDFQLLICGAGAAGLAAAKEADAHGISFVLIEKGGDVPGGVLDSNASRYVSTAMYEWPHPNHAKHNFPLSDPRLLGVDTAPFPSLELVFIEPVLIKDFGQAVKAALSVDLARWEKNFNILSMTSPNPKSVLIKSCTVNAVSKDKLRKTILSSGEILFNSLRKYRLPRLTLDYASGKPCDTFRFAYVIYAAGFSKEAVHFAYKRRAYKGFANPAFWDADQISQTNSGFPAPPNVLILGSGDGALQDALRCLVKTTVLHPLAVWNEIINYRHGLWNSLENSKHIMMAMSQLSAADAYTTGGAVWSGDRFIFKSLDETFKRIIAELYKNEKSKLNVAIKRLLRGDVKSVTIVTQDGYFTKAYALNRFLVLLFEKVLSSVAKSSKIRFKIRSGFVTKFKKTGGHFRGARIELKSRKQKNGTRYTRKVTYDMAIIRGGLDRFDSPSQQLGLSGIDTGRAELGRIPAPIRPVAIKPSSAVAPSSSSVATVPAVTAGSK